MPSISPAAIPAILDTTLSEMVVVPRSVWSGLPPLLCSVIRPSPFVGECLPSVKRYLYRPAREQPVDGEQDDRAQRGGQYGADAEGPRAAAEVEPLEHPAPDKGADDPDQGRYHDATGVGPRHHPLRQDARYQPDHYPDYYGPDAYGSHLPPSPPRASVPDGTLVEHINSRRAPRYSRGFTPIAAAINTAERICRAPTRAGPARQA